MNPPDNEHCGGCGEVLGLVPVELPSLLSCPECKRELSAFNGDPGLLHDCAACGGQFIEHDLLFNIIERRRRFAGKRPKPPGNPLTQAVRYIPCPACAQIMNRRNFGGTSGIIVDYCALHGVWFHAGELPKLLGYVAAGGLADGRRIRLGLPAARTEEQQRATAVLVADAMKQTGEPPAAPSRVVLVATGVAQGTLDLLEVLGNIILDRD